MCNIWTVMGSYYQCVRGSRNPTFNPQVDNWELTVIQVSVPQGNMDCAEALWTVILVLGLNTWFITSIAVLYEDF
jgi:hypothetical protein